MADEITKQGLTFVCEENSPQNRKERNQFSERIIKFDDIDVAINNEKIDVVKKRFAEKLELNISDITNDFLEKYYQKEHILDNALCYVDKLQIEQYDDKCLDTLCQRVIYIKQLVHVFGFKSLFDTETTMYRDSEMEKRMQVSKFLETEKYNSIVTCFGKRLAIAEAKKFSVPGYIVFAAFIVQ